MFACVHSRSAQLRLPGLPDARQPRLVECAYSFSPRVEETAPGTVIADLEGCGHLFGSDAAIAEKMARRAAELGLEVSVAVAANPDAAALAARGLPGVTVIPGGREAEMLGPLSIADCGLRIADYEPPRMQELIETLEAWGIRTLGQLAALPVAGLSERLGRDGLRLRELARGASPRALIPAVPAPGFEKSIDLEYSVALLEPLMFVVASLLNQLCRNLQERALATNEITVRLKLDTGNLNVETQNTQRIGEANSSSLRSPHLSLESITGQTPALQACGLRISQSAIRNPQSAIVHERVLRLPVPMLNSQAFLRLLQLDLEQHPPSAPVVAVWIRTRPVKPRVLQDGLFVPLAPEPQKLELTLARIAKLVGAENTGAAELLDTHRPDAFAVKKFVGVGEQVRGEKVRGAGYEVWGEEVRKGKQSAEHREPHTAHLPFPSHLAPHTSHLPFPLPLLGFRRFRPPLAAQVETVREQPVRIEVSGTRPGGDSGAWRACGIRGKVVSLSGPWRTAGDWWSPQPWERDEWDVALADGGLYRIYFDRLEQGWFVDGSYD